MVDAEPPSPPAGRSRSPVRRGRVALVDEPDLLRKPVNTLAIVPKSARITTLGRKSYNVLLFEAQEQGLDKDVFRAPLERIIKGVDFDSNDHALVKKHLRAMVSTTVEWQSPTTGEGSSWNVSGLLAHAKLSKERGQVWVEWSYAVNLKQELLQPTVFARLRLEVISQLRSHAGVALYEICTRYKDIGRTSRQAWRWWQPVLSGNPPSERTERQEYRIFKRDTLKPAVAEVNAITDIEVELVEHKQGRFIDEIQFRIQPKKQASLVLGQAPQPVEMGLIERARRLGIADDVAESLCQEHGDAAFSTALDALERRIATNFPEPLRDPARYLRALMPAEAHKARQQAADRAVDTSARDDPQSPAARELQARRQARWLAEWLNRRREQMADEVAGMSVQGQADLVLELLSDMDRRNVHPSLRKRLHTSGWQHPMVRSEMIRFYAAAVHGEGWDRPSAEQLLAIAAEIPEDAAPGR
jgi:Initiator Replication protein